MKSHRVLAASFAAALALAPSAWSQLVPQIDAKNPTSAESLAAMSQDLTERISKAKLQGADVSVAETERAQGERAIQQGNDHEALRHFQAGEQALGRSQSAPPASGR
jgi:hypothetical protein